jgi:hypothetical protein
VVEGQHAAGGGGWGSDEARPLLRVNTLEDNLLGWLAWCCSGKPCLNLKSCYSGVSACRLCPVLNADNNTATCPKEQGRGTDKHGGWHRGTMQPTAS